MAPTPVPICPQDPMFSGLCFQAPDFPGILGAFISFLLVLGIIIAFFYLLWGGLKWITSGGDKAMVEGARSQIIGAIIGLTLMLLIFLIINVVLQFFKINLGSLIIPQL
ncbi:MAG: hypothetical protein A2687_05615 [Candidatus Levybacteria bacterium RIFCSPHIGHO2_01_FULL_38_26]|nr:MAG: hypothetical protein A2687_05615 [Candidatus Levybacteria bacterium RIFCSPHIGHO2_01_FULL_38_26]